MSASERISRAANVLKLPLSSDCDYIYDATGAVAAKIDQHRTKYVGDAIRDAKSICEIINSATELTKEMESR